MLDDFRILARTVFYVATLQNEHTTRSSFTFDIIPKHTYTWIDAENCTHYSHLNAMCWAQYAPYFNEIDFYALIFIFMSFSALFIFVYMCISLKHIRYCCF